MTTMTTLLLDRCGLSQKRLRSLLDYDPATGEFQWRGARPGTRSSGVAGYRTPHGYITICINRHQHYAHRLAWLYVFNELPARVDHINGDPCDNRISNLRPATAEQNSYNRPTQKNNRSGYKGVMFDGRRSKYVARIRFDKRRIFLGTFLTAKEAAAAYEIAARQYHGSFSR